MLRIGKAKTSKKTTLLALLRLENPKPAMAWKAVRVSKQHLNRYCDEFSFRWNHRKTTDSDRAVAAIKGAEGKRLMYIHPIGH